MVGKCSVVQAPNTDGTIRYAHSAAVTAWTPIWHATFGVLIAIVSAAINVETTFYNRGQFKFKIATGVTISQGNVVYYNTTNDDVQLTDPGSSGFLLGIATEDGTAAAGYVTVDIYNTSAGAGGVGTVSSPAVLIYNGPKLADYHATCASTNASTSFEPFKTTVTMTGAGQVGGRVRHALTISAAAGGWSNALKADVTYGASGKTTGLGSAICAEMTISAGTVDGNYAPLELELNAGTGAATGTATSFMHMSMQGDGVATPRASAHLFSLNGVGSATAGSLFDTCVATPASHALRILIDGTPYYIMLTNNVDDT